MSDRAGVLLLASSPVRSWVAFAIELAVAGLCVAAFVVLGFPRAYSLLFIAPPVALIFVLVRPTRLLFRARALERTWLFVHESIAYVDIIGVDPDDHGLTLRLRDGTRRIDTHATIVRDAIVHTLGQVTGVFPESGAVTTAGGYVLPEVSSAGLSPALMTMLESAEGDPIEARDFVAAMMRGPERALLEDCGYRVALDPPRGDPYRPGGAIDRLSEDFKRSVRAARIAAVQHGNTEVSAVDLLLELLRGGDIPEVVAAGLVPMRVVDRVAHGFSAAESDVRSQGTISDAELLEGHGDRARIIVVNDPYTPYVVAERILRLHFELSLEEAAALARRADIEGSAAVGVFETGEALRLARAGMKDARSIGSPLRIRVVSEPTNT